MPLWALHGVLGHHGGSLCPEKEIQENHSDSVKSGPPTRFLVVFWKGIAQHAARYPACALLKVEELCQNP